MARSALFVSTSTYADGQLAQLPSAVRDAVELGDLFADPRIGPFSVARLESPSAQEMRLALEDLFTEATADDIVVLYVSGHGLKDPKGNLYFAAHDTRPNRLQSTAVSAQLLCSLLNDSRAAGAVIFLDCCYGGAFARGMVARAAGDPQVGDAFAALGGGARSRAVITASSAIEYAFEGDRLTDSQVEPSVFASAMRAGIADGDADRDGDGWVGLSELFEYIRQRIQQAGRPQTPHLWTFGASGDLRVTRSPRGPRASVSALPTEIRELLASPVAAARLGAATDLRDRAAGTDLPMARAAVAALLQLAEDDSLRVREAAGAALAACAPGVRPETLSLVGGGDSATVRLIGPPVALEATLDTVPEGVTATLTGDQLVVQATVDAPAGEAEIQLRWAGGGVPVVLTVEQQAALDRPKTRRAARPGRSTAPVISSRRETELTPSVEERGPEPTAAPAKPPDDPRWLLAGALLWLGSLFLPAGSDGETPLTSVETWLIVYTVTPGIVAAGLAGFRWVRRQNRATLLPAQVVAIFVHGQALIMALWLVQDNEFWVASVAVVLAIAGLWTYLLGTVRHDVRLSGQSRDQPAWLIAAAVFGALMACLPVYADNAIVLALTGWIGNLFLLLSLAALGAGSFLYRRRRRRLRGVPVIGVVSALVLVVLAVSVLVLVATDDDGFGFGSLASAVSLTCALIYLANALFRRRIVRT
ncbi:caspase family protein [Flindersiella endophytica]